MLNRKVSVIVTVLNEEKSIGRLLESLLSQTKKADEIVIVDGGSRDKTVEIVEHYQKNLNTFEEIRLFVKKGNRSIGRNYAIKKARNEIIAVTDAGGYPATSWLEKITDPFVDSGIEIVSGYYQAQAKTAFQKAVAPYFLVMKDKILPDQEFLPSSRSVAFRKTLWERVGGYPEEFDNNEDLVFDYNLKKLGVKFFFEPRALVFWEPPRTLTQALRQMYRFAFGDAESGIKRPKIMLIYLRYFFALVLLFLGYYQFLLILFLLYVIWSVQKNFRYAKMVSSLFWLPVIQITSDLVVMLGDQHGRLKR